MSSASRTELKKETHIGHINTRYLLNKVHEIAILLKDSKIDILGISETHLNPTHDDSLFLIPNHVFYRKDSKSKVGHTGMCVYINSSIAPFVKRRYDLESEKIESIWLELKTSHASPVLIGFVYRHPSEPICWYDTFHDLLDNTCLKNRKLLLLGDFNIDENSSIHPLWQATKDIYSLKQLVTTCTRIDPRTGSSTLLDHIYTNSKEHVVNIHTWSVSFSDHNPISCSLSIT